MDAEALFPRWEAAWQAIRGEEATAPRDVFAALVDAYNASDRHYHNLAHVVDCLRKLDEACALAVNPAEIEIAFWFHDAIYDTHAPDNEERSAAWAAEAVGGAPGERIQGLILATKHRAIPTDEDARLLVDIDLSILGADEPVFWAYEAAIRNEYAWVPESIFREKRAEILEGFLQRDPIYLTPYFRDRYETPARRNLANSVARLRQ